MMTASKGLSPEVGRCLAGVVSDLVNPSATWATKPTTPGGIGKTTGSFNCALEILLLIYVLYLLNSFPGRVSKEAIELGQLCLVIWNFISCAVSSFNFVVISQTPVKFASTCKTEP